MDNTKIKEALVNALALLNREVETKYYRMPKPEYRRVVTQLENTLKEFGQ
jgi:translation initiation factor 2 alpha subunit (eIF-2alpha)